MQLVAVLRSDEHQRVKQVYLKDVDMVGVSAATLKHHVKDHEMRSKVSALIGVHSDIASRSP